MVCALATLALVLWRIDRPVLWRDELATWTASGRDLSELFAMLGNVDASSGGFYVFQHFWTAVFGDSVLALRLPAALAMAGTAACVAALAAREFGGRAGMCAGLLFAVIPAVSRYGQEARAYGFVCLTVSAATLLLARALERPTAPRWFAYGATVTMLGLWHLVALAALAGHIAWVALRTPRAWRRFAVTVAAALAPVAPLAAVAAGQRVRQVEWIAHPDAEAFSSYPRRLFASTPVAATVLALAVVACVLHARAAGRRRTAVAAFAASAVLPVAVVWAVSEAGDTSYFLPRYLLFTLPAWAVLAGAAAARLPGRAFAAAAVAAAVAATAALGTPDQRTLREPGAHERRNHPDPAATSWIDYAGIQRVVAAAVRPGDGIVYASVDQRLWHVDTALAYYARGTRMPDDVLLGATGPDRDDLWDHDCPDPAACLDAAAAERLWLVAIVPRGTPDDPYYGVTGDKRRELRARYHAVRSVAVAGAYVTLLERGPTAPAEPCPDDGHPFRKRQDPQEGCPA